MLFLPVAYDRKLEFTRFHQFAQGSHAVFRFVQGNAIDRGDYIAGLQSYPLDNRVFLGESQLITIVDRFGLGIFGQRCRIADKFTPDIAQRRSGVSGL